MPVPTSSPASPVEEASSSAAPVDLKRVFLHVNGIPHVNGIHADPTPVSPTSVPKEKPSDEATRVETPAGEAGQSASSSEKDAKAEDDEEVKGKAEEAEEAKPKEPELPAGSRSEFKRVDEVYDKDDSKWIVRDSGEVTAEDKSDKYREFCFTVYRKFNSESTDFFTSIHIKSPYLKKVGKAVIGSIPGVSWNPAIVKIDPDDLLAWLPYLRNHLTMLKENEEPGEDEAKTVDHLSILVNFLTAEYASTLEQIDGLVPHGEITFELLWSIMLSRTLLYTVCPMTDQSRVVELVGAELVEPWPEPNYWELTCRYVDSTALTSTSAPKFGHAIMHIKVPIFKGAVKIASLSAYPLKFHQREDDLRAKLIARGRRWMELEGTHHMAYNGTAFQQVQYKRQRVTITGRVMIDKVTFKRINANYAVQAVEGARDSDSDDFIYRRTDNSDDGSDADREEILLVNELTDGQMLLTTPVLYGFSLVDKTWLEFNVDCVKPIVWNDGAFSNLVLPPAQKELIQSLVEAHSQQDKFDDFIEGKGQGLIFNLYGPPGIGKTMSAEATSEHVRRPLYVVKSSDLGIQAEALDAAITEVFDIAHTWGAVVLLDEADVYMEERSVSDLARNALVAVFLRQLEYFRGILFLTTNRVKTFDEAFQSRIHVSLRFRDLDRAAKRHIWKAFLVKVGLGDEDFTEKQWEALSLKKINGRQIKNCVRTAQALAKSKSQRLTFEHLDQVLTVMDQFEQDFRHPVGGEVQFYS